MLSYYLNSWQDDEDCSNSDNCRYLLEVNVSMDVPHSHMTEGYTTNN
jgi:hypothetical protein